MVDFFLRDSEFSQDLLVWNALVTLRPFIRLRERFLLFRRKRFVVNRSVCEGTREGIEHGLEQPDDGGHLCRSKPLDQFVRMLFLATGTVYHEIEFSEFRRSMLRMNRHPVSHVLCEKSGPTIPIPQADLRRERREPSCSIRALRRLFAGPVWIKTSAGISNFLCRLRIMLRESERAPRMTS